MRLWDLATVIRSKNAGPFTLTIDVVLPDMASFRRVLGAAGLASARIATLYDVPADTVRVVPFERVLTIKVALPRPVGSGAPGDRDVYGCQQHFPLAGIEI